MTHRVRSTWGWKNAALLVPGVVRAGQRVVAWLLPGDTCCIGARDHDRVEVAVWKNGRTWYIWVHRDDIELRDGCVGDGRGFYGFWKKKLPEPDPGA